MPSYGIDTGTPTTMALLAHFRQKDPPTSLRNQYCLSEACGNISTTASITLSGPPNSPGPRAHPPSPQLLTAKVANVCPPPRPASLIPGRTIQ
ncbi:jg9523 [Pararge aegeria aegeria]|uniref:Jg9523 protein n=1 Tax=Pararge aegeria aegeria TaxID=348720 RepID=A0A8S4RLW0_9NEOP|nr:jg9523 [Pararge aegeria aegeria]